MATEASKESATIQFFDGQPPFSNFDFVDKYFGGCTSIRRLFSQARGSGVQKSFVLEEIPATGVVADENEEIHRLYPDHSMIGLRRITFWSEVLASAADVEAAEASACLGYALLKRDLVPSLGKKQWHVFEAVMRPTGFQHSYVPASKAFPAQCGNKTFTIDGVLYCQQNGLNKACAQVALRSLCAIHVDPAELPFSKINDLASHASGQFDPSQGLEVKEIRAVLDGLGIRYTDIDYNELSSEEKSGLEYQKFLYSGIESGAGALLGFKLMGPNATGHHIIPFFGHTFNQDMWIPKAEAAYFHVGEETRYVPSEAWTSTFVGHDDNFGSNYCIPRLYITAAQAQYVVSLYRDQVQYSGVEAETIAVNVLYSIRKSILPSTIPWLRRVQQAIDDQEVVLRTISVTRSEYIRHLKELVDWEFSQEDAGVCDSLASSLPDHLWMVELSLPELFPANLRKVGEILLNATVEPIPGTEASVYILARLPSSYIVGAGLDSDGTPNFTVGPSDLTSHTPVYSRN